VRKQYFAFIFFYLILIGLIFRNLFHFSFISGGDYIIFWPENISYLKKAAFLTWDGTINFGANALGILHYAPYNFFMSWVGKWVGNNTVFWERLVWWIPFFAIAFYSIVQLFRKLFPQNSFWFLAPLIFIFNTYVLMMLGGGQIAGIGLAYALAPLVLKQFISLVEACHLSSFEKIKNFTILQMSLVTGLLLAAQIMFDLRIAYVTFIGILLYIILNIPFKNLKKSISFLLYTIVIPLGTALFLHAFWIIPILIFRVNTIAQLGAIFNSSSAVIFFSFAKFENTLSLLQPNWPENLFGKVYFMRAEFLILPLLAFSSLLLLPKKKQPILFFALLSLIAAFLAKGANDPLGQLYLWMFHNIPGFIMFRDPTKFYVLIALSYSILIPFTISFVYNFLRSKFIHQKYLSTIFLLAIITFLLFLIRPAILGQLNGIFQNVQIPAEYLQLKNFIVSQKEFGRTLWIPQRSRFAFSSITHPPVDALSFFQVSSASDVLDMLKKNQNEKFFEEAAIKYIILPDDTQKEIFLKNGKYNEDLHQKAIQELHKRSWLKEDKKFEKIIVYKVLYPKDHLWISSQTGTIHIDSQAPVKYVISVKNVKKGDKLIFSDSFDPRWLAVSDKEKIVSTNYYNLNSFSLPKNGNYKVTISYVPQSLLLGGFLVSIFTFLLVLFYAKK